MTGARFAIASLATWRVTHLLAREDGPGDVVVRLRARAGTGPLGELMDCFYCLSFWVAVPFAVAAAPRRRDLAATTLAVSGAACLLERLVPHDVFLADDGAGVDERSQSTMLRTTRSTSPAVNG